MKQLQQYKLLYEEAMEMKLQFSRDHSLFEEEFEALGNDNKSLSEELLKLQNINEELVCQCEKLYITNENNQTAMKQLSEINEELIQSIDMEKKAKDQVAQGYSEELRRMKGAGVVQKVLCGVEIERLQVRIGCLEYQIEQGAGLGSDLEVIPEELEDQEFDN